MFEVPKMRRCVMKLPLQARLMACALCLMSLIGTPVYAGDTFVPYVTAKVPKTAVALWEDYDPRIEPLDVEVVQEWVADGVVTRYVIFTVGTFKGAK